MLGGDHSKATPDLCISACHYCHGRVDGGRSRRRRKVLLIGDARELDERTKAERAKEHRACVRAAADGAGNGRALS
jgi:hypothetical protein